jgi:hypothetical protein
MAFIIQRLEIEINHPDNLTLHVSRVSREGKPESNVIELKKFSSHFVFGDNKHVMDTSKFKDFRFDTTESRLKEVKAVSQKFKVFKITFHYITS